MARLITEHPAFTRQRAEGHDRYYLRHAEYARASRTQLEYR
jgi:hypothetical protein